MNHCALWKNILQFLNIISIAKSTQFSAENNEINSVIVILSIPFSYFNFIMEHWRFHCGYHFAHIFSHFPSVFYRV